MTKHAHEAPILEHQIAQKPSKRFCIIEKSGMKKNSMFNIWQEMISVKFKTKIVLNWCFMKTEVKKEAERIWIYENRIKIVIYEFETLNKSICKARKSIHLRRQKLKPRHHEWLYRFIEVVGIKGYSLEIQEPTC